MLSHFDLSISVTSLQIRPIRVIRSFANLNGTLHVTRRRGPIQGSLNPMDHRISAFTHRLITRVGRAHNMLRVRPGITSRFVSLLSAPRTHNQPNHCLLRIPSHNRFVVRLFGHISTLISAIFSISRHLVNLRRLLRLLNVIRHLLRLRTQDRSNRLDLYSAPSRCGWSYWWCPFRDLWVLGCWYSFS